MKSVTVKTTKIKKVMKLKAGSSGKMDYNDKRANKLTGWMNCEEEESREPPAKTDIRGKR